tara:strand:+ start:31 stop:276 length:246 start_codon:yes stop_codon:yes gene_type:complete
MSSPLMNISKVLAEASAKTSLTQNIKLDPDLQKKLNYEVMYKTLEGEVEKFVIENNGNPLVDKFKDTIVQKFSYLIMKLQG